MEIEIKQLSPLSEAMFYVLLVLQNPLHGYGVIKEIEDLTKGRLTLAAGTLYGAMQNLHKNRLIALDSNDLMNKRRKVYHITKDGLDLIGYETKRIKEMIRSTKKIIIT